MKIKIGTATSQKTPSSWQFIEDDRMEQIKILQGVHYQDNGIFQNNIKVNAIFSAAEFEKLKEHRINREAVTVYDEQERKLENEYFIKINSYKYVQRFDYYEVDFELLHNK